MKKKNIMLVEDYKPQLMVLEMGLSRMAACSKYEDGKFALNALKKCKDEELPDFIITDYMMPQMNGVELANALGKISRLKSIPVILYTGGNSMITEDYASANVIGVVDKNESISKIIEIIDQQNQKTNIN